MEHPKDFPSVPLEAIRFLPTSSGIYFALSNQRVLYIGQSANIRDRWRNHNKYNELSLWENVRIHFCPSDGRPLLEQEAEWINAFSPILNTIRVRKLGLLTIPALPPVIFAYIYIILGGASAVYGTWFYSDQLSKNYQIAIYIFISVTALLLGSWLTFWIMKRESSQNKELK